MGLVEVILRVSLEVILHHLLRHNFSADDLLPLGAPPKLAILFREREENFAPRLDQKEILLPKAKKELKLHGTTLGRKAPHSRSPVSLIVLPRSCSCRWGPCPSPIPRVCP